MQGWIKKRYNNFQSWILENFSVIEDKTKNNVENQVR
jgi:hypothetical protein